MSYNARRKGRMSQKSFQHIFKIFVHSGNYVYWLIFHDTWHRRWHTVILYEQKMHLILKIWEKTHKKTDIFKVISYPTDAYVLMNCNNTNNFDPVKMFIIPLFQIFQLNEQNRLRLNQQLNIASDWKR